MAQPVTAEQLEKLRPYLCGQASPAGEVDTYCPLHQDGKRSAQVNLKKGLFYCNAGCGGLTVRQLVEAEGYWLPPHRNGAEPFREGVSQTKDEDPEQISLLKIRRWHKALMADEDDAGSLLQRVRGIDRPTMERFELGWDGLRRVFTIPIRSARGKVWNVRRYDPKVPADSDRRKIWGLRGHNDPKLFPAIMAKEPGPIVICEGEWDALMTIQNGFAAITRTGAAHVWKAKWSKYFVGRTVYLCHDCDTMGELANKKVAQVLRPVASRVLIVNLPYEYTPKHGMDLTDYWIDGHTPFQFKGLLAEAVEA